MNESAENTPSRLVCPTEEDVDQLRVIIDTKSTGANIHALINCLGIMDNIVVLAKRIGWQEEDLKIYNEEKEKLYKLLLEIK